MVAAAVYTFTADACRMDEPDFKLGTPVSFQTLCTVDFSDGLLLYSFTLFSTIYQ